MSNSFDPGMSDVPPDVPADRIRAAETIEAVSAHNAKVDDLAASNPVPWAGRIKGRSFSDRSANHLMDQIDWAGLAIETLIKQIGKIAPVEHPIFPKTLGEARALLEGVVKFAGCHKQATLLARIEEFDRDVVDGLVAEIEHHRKTRETLISLVTAEDPLSHEVRDVVRQAGEAVDLLKAHGSDDLASAQTALEALQNLDDDIKTRVRRLTLMATRLNLPDATVGDLVAFSNACSVAKAEAPATLHAMAEVAGAGLDILDHVRRKVAKIKHAAGLLDGKFGSAWRQEPLEKVSRASAIADIPKDPRHPKVAEYARSFGVNMRFQESLAAITKTKAAIASIEDSPELKALLPTSFKGMDTNFALLSSACELRARLVSMLGDRDGAKTLIDVFATNSRAVADDFFALSDLEEVARGIPVSASTPLREVRVGHERRKTELANAISTISTIPSVEQTVATAARLRNLFREMDASSERIEATTILKDANAPRPNDILEALDWKKRFAEILPEDIMPKSDEGLAHLLVVARQTTETLGEWQVAIKDCKELLNIDGLPDDGTALTAIQPLLIEIRAIEPVVHAQVGLCIAMDRAVNGGLGAFVSRMTTAGIAVAEWNDRLAADYREVDRIAAEEIFANELLAAAEDAAGDQVDLTMIIPAPVPRAPSDRVTSDLSTWIEEEVIENLALNVTAKVEEASAAQ